MKTSEKKHACRNGYKTELSEKTMWKEWYFKKKKKTILSNCYVYTKG